MDHQTAPSIPTPADVDLLAHGVEIGAERLYDQIIAAAGIAERDALGIELTADTRGRIVRAVPNEALPAGQAWIISRNQP